MSTVHQKEEAAQGPIQAASSQDAQPHYSADPKQFSTLRARAAMAGVELRACRNDLERWTFFATAGAETLELPTLADVDTWLSSRSCAGVGLEGHDAP